MIRAVIFDMDGVLIDSEPVYLQDLSERLHAIYPWVTRESMYPLVGMSGTEDKRFLAELTHRDAQDPAFLSQLQEMYSACRVHYPDILRPCVPALLQELRGMGCQLALASSSSTECIARVLEQCGLTDCFDSVISGDQFHESKPNPEIYLYTMKRLGRRPEECLIVEDSTYGVKAGVAAGAVVAALQDDRFPFDQSAARLHIQSLQEIPGLVRRNAQPIRAVFFDVDGTLAAVGTHAIPESTRTALRLLREKGVYTILSTGRHALEIEQENILPGLKFDGYIYMNSQLCILDEKVILRNCFSAAQLHALRLFLEQRQRTCIFLEQNELYCNRVDARMEREQARIGTALPPVRSMDGLEQREIYQAIPFISAEEETELLAQVPGCKLLRWGDAVVDLTSGSGDKSIGIQAICTALGISPEETMAFGDAENDVEMLRMVGIGVAMGNGCECAKQAANYITDALENNGIQNALMHFGIIECEGK